MPNETTPHQLSKYAYKSRIVVIAAALLFILYGAAFIWFYTPYGGPIFQWRPDAQLIIQSATNDNSLQLGDRVLAINSKPLIRMRPIYPLPLQTDYTFTVQRGNVIKSVLVPVFATMNNSIVQAFLPATLLALSGWLVGTIILLLANKENHEALSVGYIFLLSAVVLMGIQASLEGTPGTWIGGHSGIFVLAVSWVYLGTLPRTKSLPRRVQKLFFWLYAGSLLLGLIAAFEVLYLFPQSTSIQELTGVSLYSLGFLLSAVGLIVCVIILTIRVLCLPQGQYLRQQLLILLVFIGIGILPAMLLTVIPRALWDVTPLPFPLAMLLMLFVPAGYLFVIYRKGFLGLDVIFSRIIHLVLLALLVFGFYIGGFYLVQSWLKLPGLDAVLPATVIFFPTLLFTLHASEPINRFVQQVVYGNIVLTQDKLAELALALSTRPEIATLESMVTAVAKMLSIPQAFLALTNEGGQLVPLGQMAVHSGTSPIPQSAKNLQRPLLRSRIDDAQTHHSLFAAMEWAELLIPVRVRQESIGVLALSRPDDGGYFNAQEVHFLTQAANVLAVGSENIYLFESTRKLSRERLSFQEQERRKLSLQIHDDPLQQITYATTIIDQLVSYEGQNHERNARLPQVATHLRQAAKTLRDICFGLYPPMQEQGVDLAVQEIVAQFQATYGLQTAVSIQKESPTERAGKVNDKQVTAVCRILTESLNNIVKHAPDATVQISLNWSDKELLLSVMDDGPGHPFANSSFSELLLQGHLGIVGMVEWARLVGGELQLDTVQPSGSYVSFSCPLSGGEPLNDHIIG